MTRLLATDKDTICALATAQGIGAISVIRISGVQAVEITRKLAAFLPQHLESHKIYYGILKSPQTAAPLDEVLISYFQEGRSFTGESTCEISCHGSDSIVGEVLSALMDAGARAAKRGEFTYRAFMNGRIDLVQAESVLALIESRSTRASQLALRQLQGEFSTKLKEILDLVTWTLAQLEANIDFASEDIVIAGPDLLVERLRQALTAVERLLLTYKQGRVIKDGFQVALMGRPNAGKSSLLNALAGEERAIVTAQAGTTRDFVEIQTVINGIRVAVIDTAGLRQTQDEVEAIGVRRTLDKATQMDLIALVCDSEHGVLDEDRLFLEKMPWDKTVVLWNKSDLTEGVKPDEPVLDQALEHFVVSAKTHSGLESWKSWIAEYLQRELSEDSTVISNARHYESLEILRASLNKSLSLVLSDSSPDLVALELQTGLRALYEILGMVYDDQVMDRVFAEFCLGK